MEQKESKRRITVNPPDLNELVAEIKVKLFEPECKPEAISIGNWIDLRSAVDKTFARGEFFLIPLGVAMQLPKGYEAHVAPRSSTFKNYGLLQTNSVGIVDNSYCGDNDQWFMPVIAMRESEIKKGERVCQFRIVESMPKVSIEIVEALNNADRGGHGSTGTK